VQIIDASTGKEKKKLHTSHRPIDVKGTKVIFWGHQKSLKSSDCQGQETAPGLGCFQIEKIEIDLSTEKKRHLGITDILSIQ